MVCELEDPTGDLCLLRPLVFIPGKLYDSAGDYGVFVGGGFIVSPQERMTFQLLDEQTMNSVHGVVRLAAMENH